MPHSMATDARNRRGEFLRFTRLGFVMNPDFIVAAGFVAVILLVLGLTLVLPLPGETVDLPMPLP